MKKYIVLAVVLALFSGCKRGGIKQVEKPVPVKVEKIKLMKYTITRPIPGYAKGEEIILKSRGGGKVEKVFKKEGDFVRKGEIIAEIGTSIYASQLKIAEAQLKNAEDEFKRIDELFKKSLVSRSQWEKMKVTLVSARERYNEAKINYNLSILSAPFSGYIEDFDLKEGELVTPGYPIGKIVKGAVTEIDAYLPGEAFDIKRGDILTFIAGDRKYKGKISYISKGYIVNGNFRKIVLKTRPLELPWNMPVTVLVPVVKDKEGILVPLEAVKFTKEGKSVFVVKGGEAYEVPVETGVIVDERIEVLSGLSPGENLVVTGQQYLKTGMKVIVK